MLFTVSPMPFARNRLTDANQYGMIGPDAVFSLPPPLLPMRSTPFINRDRVDRSVIRMILTGVTLWTLLAPLQGQTSLTVWAGFDRLPDRSAVEWMEQEAGALFSDAGLTFAWRRRPEDAEAVGPLVSVQFHGKCALEAGAVPLPAHGPMAWVQPWEGEILSFIDVDCDRTAALVWQNRGTLPLPLVTRAFGRALARVLAHELYHYLTQSAVHNASGLFRPAMTSMDLTVPQVRFESGEIEALREGMSKLDGMAQRVA